MPLVRMYRSFTAHSPVAKRLRRIYAESKAALPRPLRRRNRQLVTDDSLKRVPFTMHRPLISSLQAYSERKADEAFKRYLQRMREEKHRIRDKAS